MFFLFSYWLTNFLYFLEPSETGSPLMVRRRPESNNIRAIMDVIDSSPYADEKSLWQHTAHGRVTPCRMRYCALRQQPGYGFTPYRIGASWRLG